MTKVDFQPQRGRFAGISTEYWIDDNHKGTPMILLHGLGGTHAGLMQLAEQLADYHIFMPDIPGHGGTCRPRRKKVDLDQIASWFEQFVNFVHAQTGRQPVVVAHSYGTFIAYLACQRRDTNFRKCILVAPVERASLAPRVVQKIIAKSPKWFAYLMAVSGSFNFVRHYYFLVRRDRSAIQRMRRAVSTNSGPWGAKYYAAIGDELIDRGDIFDTITRANSFYCVAPSHDKMLHPEADARLSQVLRDDHIKVCPRSGHMVPFEAPADLADIIRSFI